MLGIFGQFRGASGLSDVSVTQHEAYVMVRTKYATSRRTRSTRMTAITASSSTGTTSNT
jgi:hypothetical protein